MFKYILTIIFQVILVGKMMNNCFADQEIEPFKIKPWSVGQFVVYQITSFEGEDADNRYQISLIGEEVINGKRYFWEKIDIWESLVTYGYNSINKELVKNISFKALVPAADYNSFMMNASDFISNGIFPGKAIKLSVQINDGPWKDIQAKDFFNHQDVIEDTPYSVTPYAKGRIDFSKLKLDTVLRSVTVPAGEIYCYHFYVNTEIDEEYWDEGFDLWRSQDIPILGLVRMQFSKTLFWEKWKLKNQNIKKVLGRMRPDDCIMSLIDYGPK
ncbi:MAG: hypothetical protein NTZ63_05490 [Candidatus Omnitrophica bacterium]|nr:hypothetical protein [Candidatus Omnitrophota bacterium]